MNNIEKAMAYATEKHKNQTRKLTGEPYINHIKDVANILIENGANEETIIVGILHDTLEDTSATYNEISKMFGRKIANMVKTESEIKSLPYKKRKAEHMGRVGEADFETKLVNCADKVSNLKSMIAIYSKYGDNIWNYFHGTKEEIMWYYTIALNALKDVSNKKVYYDFCTLYKKMFNKRLLYVNLLTNKEIIELFDKIVPQNDVNWFTNKEIVRYKDHVEITAWSICDYQLTLKLNNHVALASTTAKSAYTKKYIKEMYKLFGIPFKKDCEKEIKNNFLDHYFNL